MGQKHSDHPVAASLRRRSILYVCHMTPCHLLPSIFASGGLLSLTARRAAGMAEQERTHNWGGENKREVLADYVVCGFETPKWMLRKHPEELALIVVDAYAACCREGALFCPGDSAADKYPVAEILEMSGAERFDRCFEEHSDQEAKFSEILVPDRVPAEHFRGLIFCDREARDFWMPKIGSMFPDAPLTATIRNLWKFGFPQDWNPGERVRP